MKISLICSTADGGKLCGNIIDALKKEGHECFGYRKGTFSGTPALREVSAPLREWAEAAFSGRDALIFIGAAGIAVRAIAPFVKSKTTDPACIAVDEQGTYVIPLLSGHIGGANQLAESIAAGIGALPVITTATDLNGLFAVDEWARMNHLYITDMKKAKQIAASLLEGKTCGFFSSFPVSGVQPEELVSEASADDADTGIEVSIAARARNEKALQLIPGCVVLGIGCRKHTSEQAISSLVDEVLESAGISEKAVCAAASIDLKAREEGLLAFCRTRGIPFRVFGAQELAAVEGDFSISEFVSSITGVDNVCERAAVLASGNGSLIVKKRARDGVTAAVAIQNPKLEWPKKRKRDVGGGAEKPGTKSGNSLAE